MEQGGGLGCSQKGVECVSVWKAMCVIGVSEDVKKWIKRIESNEKVRKAGLGWQGRGQDKDMDESVVYLYKNCNQTLANSSQDICCPGSDRIIKGTGDDRIDTT